MTTTPQIPAPSPEMQESPLSEASQPSATDPALVPVPDEASGGTLELPEVTGPVALLPIELEVSVPVRNFRVHDLLTLESGQVIESQWHSGEDVPLVSGQVHLAWSEFEVIESDLAVRITRLA